MTISYQTTRRDVADAGVAMAVRTRWYLFGFWMLLLAFALWINRWAWHGPASQRVAALTPVTICGLIFIAMAWAGPRLRARRIILREVTWVLGDEGVHLQTNVSSADIKWEAFLRYRETSTLFLLFVQKGMAQFIPKRALSTEETAGLRALLASHIKAQ